MGRLSNAQRAALTECLNAGSLWNDGSNLWRWYRTLPNGMTYLCASNPTVATLQARGLVERVEKNRVSITPKGRDALTSQHGQSHD